METPSRHSFTLDGSTRVFPIPSPIKGDNYCRLEVDGTIINDRTKYDIVNNSIVVVDVADVPSGSQLDVLVVQSEEAIGQLTITTNIDIVASNIADVNTVADDITNVGIVSGNIADVNRVAISANNLDRVHASIDNIDRVDLSTDKVDRVFTSIANVDRVSTSANNLDRVHTSIANVDRVNTSIAAVDTVAADLNEPVSEIETVAGSITSVNTVGTNIANVNTVAGISSNVTTVAGNTANVNTTAANIASVNTVATNIVDVVSVADNMAEVLLADTNAAASASAASTSATNAANSASAASTSETNAGTSATNAANSASAAATSASNAATSETNAAASASSASSSASAASSSASDAATEVTYAAEWANKAEDSATAAANSEANVKNAQQASRNTVLNQEAVSQGQSTRTGMSSTKYTGNGTSQSVDAGVDMATGDFGGLAWTKVRSVAGYNHFLYDTVRGAQNRIESNTTAVESNLPGVTAFTSTGFDVGSQAHSNLSGADLVAWTFQTTEKTPFNLCKYSEDFTNATWTDPLAEWSVVGDNVVDPLGGTTADTITATDSTGSLIRQNALGGAGSTQYTVSYWAKVLNGTSVSITTDINDGGPVTQVITSEWVRYTNTVTSGAGGNYLDLEVLFSGATADISIWGVQVVEGSVPKEYVKTTSAASGPLTNRGKEYTSHYNPQMGFSIVGFGGDGVGGHEIPHHLTQEPELSIYRNRDVIQDWFVVFGGHDSYVYLNQTVGQTSFGGQYPATDKTVRIGSGAVWNGSGNNIISYHFHSVQGVSKVGSYVGTGAAGNYVDCGFKVGWALIKRLDGTGGWMLMDSARGENRFVYANSSAVEGVANLLQFVDDGFVVTSTSTEVNAVNSEYLFLAFAETNSDANKSWTDYSYPTTADTLTIEQDSQLSFADGFDANGPRDLLEVVGAGVTHVLGAGFKDKTLYLYKDRGGAFGTTEYRNLAGTSRATADEWGVVSPLDASLRTTAKHSGYESSTGVVLASGESTPAYRAFDKKSPPASGQIWQVASTTASWLQYKQTEKRVLKSWRIREDLQDQSPKRFTIEGSNDGLNWTAIDSTYTAADYVGNGASLWGDLQDTSYNTTAYLYHRINITANNGNSTYTTIAEMEFNTELPSDYFNVVDGVMYEYRGPELVTNGTFDTDLSGWTVRDDAGGSTTWEAGQAKQVYTSGVCRLKQSFTTTPGVTYELIANVSLATNLQVGTTDEGNQLGYFQLVTGENSVIFTATTATTHIVFFSVSPSTIYYDNVSVKRIDEPVERIYLAKIITDTNGDVASFENFPVAKALLNDLEVFGDLKVRGKVDHFGSAIAMVEVDVTQSPPLVIRSKNVYDVVELATGQHRIIPEGKFPDAVQVLYSLDNQDGGGTYRQFIMTQVKNSNGIEFNTINDGGVLADSFTVTAYIYDGEL